jgi:hypothetical protein
MWGGGRRRPSFAEKFSTSSCEPPVRVIDGLSLYLGDEKSASEFDLHSLGITHVHKSFFFFFF